MNITNLQTFDLRFPTSRDKVGTDAVLLGSWVNVKGAKKILDIGTGCGVIALMLAQRTEDDVMIDAIEVEKADAAQAMENILSSPWPNKVSVFEKSLKEFNPGMPYDLIVSNPPFFINSLLSSPGMNNKFWRLKLPNLGFVCWFL